VSFQGFSPEVRSALKRRDRATATKPQDRSSLDVTAESHVGKQAASQIGA